MTGLRLLLAALDGMGQSFLEALSSSSNLQGFFAGKSTEASLRLPFHHQSLRKILLSFLSLESQNFYVKKFFKCPHIYASL